MNNMTGDEIPGDNIESVVLDALRREPDFELPARFADRVVAVAERKIAQREAARDRWWLLAGIFSLVVAFIYAAAAVDFSPRVGSFFSGYSGLIVFGCFFVAALHLLDKLILSKNRVEP